MMKSRMIAAAAGAALLAGLVGAPSAQAEDTTVTFTVAAGSLTIAYEGAEGGALGSVPSVIGGTSVSGALGTLKVSDSRASLAGWTVRATMAGAFTTTGDSIPCKNATVTLGSVTNDAFVTPTNLAAAGLALVDADNDGDCSDVVALVADGATLMTAVTTGSNTASFTSSISVSIPADALAGTYTGTLTQTVA